MEGKMDIAIVLNGPNLDLEVAEPYIICADGGYNLLKGEKTPDIIIGDMDSIGELPENIRTRIVPKQKDFTDGEFAIRLACETKGVQTIKIYGAFGGRPDHQLANLGLLRIAKSQNKKAIIVAKGITVSFETSFVEYETDRGDIISVISSGGDAILDGGKGLFYEIKDLHLNSFDSRGISNIATDNKISFSIKKGEIYLFIIKENNY
jgi:thiamine pyrophosphokinase